MITRDDQLQQAVAQLGRMYHALAALRADVLPRSEQRFVLMAQGPLEEIRRLRADIDAYSGVSAAEESSADLWMRVVGNDIDWPSAPASVLTALVDALRKGVQAAAEVLSTGQLKTRPTNELKRACDLRVVALQPGSLRVGLCLPDDVEPRAQLPVAHEPADIARAALAKYLVVVGWISSNEAPDQLAAQIPDENERRHLLNAVRSVAPRPRGLVEVVELAGRSLGPRRVARLDRAAAARIDEAIDVTVAETRESHSGDLREIDLDNRSFILRNLDQVHEIRCVFEDDMIELAKASLDKRVRVTGVRRLEGGRRAGRSLLVTRLEVVEAEDGNSGPEGAGEP